MDENRANEQNERMRDWFRQRSGLEDVLLSVHMKEIDRLLGYGDNNTDSGKCPKCGALTWPDGAEFDYTP